MRILSIIFIAVALSSTAFAKDIEVVECANSLDAFYTSFANGTDNPASYPFVSYTNSSTDNAPGFVYLGVGMSSAAFIKAEVASQLNEGGPITVKSQQDETIAIQGTVTPTSGECLYEHGKGTCARGEFVIQEKSYTLECIVE